MKWLKILNIGLVTLALPFGCLKANPNGAAVVNGSASFSQQGNTLAITNSPGTIINWQGFSIAPDEVTRFIQQNAGSAVLNRVVGQDPSQILGQLQSNGRVYIINPNGILFGQNAIVDVNGLVASTLNISNHDFLNNNLNFTGDDLSGVIENHGHITTDEGGLVYLIAPDIENHGVITSPNGDVILAAGHSVQLVHSDNPDLRVTLTAEGEALNVGEIITRGGKTSIYAGLIHQQGTVSADTAVAGENGKIYFKASHKITLASDSVTTADGTTGGEIKIRATDGLSEVSGKVSATGADGEGGDILILGDNVGVIDEASINASGTTGGGTILIGGDTKGSNPEIQNAKGTFVSTRTSIHADATKQGDGGTVILWSDKSTRAYGTITAKGGSIYGNGGFVETSGGYLDIAGLSLDVSAVNGSAGSWLLDPYDITITNTTTVNTTAGPVYTATATGSNIFNGDINAQLDAGTAVTIDTTGAGADAGNITVDAGITKSTGANTSLTLKAHNNIVINQSISSSVGTLDVTLTADQDLNNTGGIRVNNQILSNNGNITLTAYDDIKADIWVGTVPVLNAGTGDVSLTSSGGSILRFGNTDVLSNNLALNAATGINGSSYFVVNSNTVTFNNSTSGFVNIFNQNAGTPTVTGSNNGGYVFYHGATSGSTTINNITANGLIGFRVDNPLFAGTINAGTNDVYFQTQTFNSPMSVNGASTFNLNDTTLSNITAGTIHVGFDGLYGNYADTVAVSTSLGTTFGNYQVKLYGKNGVTLGASGTTASGNLTVRGDAVTISGGVNAGTNNVYLSPFNNVAISIDGSQTFNLTQAEINQISASDLFIGTDGTTTRATIGSISTSAATSISLASLHVVTNNDMAFGTNNFTNTGQVIFKSDTGSVMTGGGVVSASHVALDGANTVTVGNGGISTTSGGTNINAVNNIQLNGNIFSSGGGPINVTSTSGAIDVSTAINATGSAFTASASGYISLNVAGVDITAGSVSLTSTNSYINGSDTATYDINAGSISLNTSAGISSGPSTAFGVNTSNLSFNNTTSNNVYLRNYWAATHSVTGTNSSTGNTHIEAINPSTLTVNNITTNGSLSILTDIIDVVGNINVNMNNIYLAPMSSIAISLDGAQTFDLTQGELLNLTNFSNLMIGHDGVSTKASAAFISTNAATNVGSGTSTATVRATGDITMGANNFSAVGNSINLVSDTGNIIGGAGNLTAGNVTFNAAGSITDGNGNGVLDVNATNLTVIAGGNASLDYQITGTLNATGVAGTADLRPFGTSASNGTTSTNEPTTTTLNTITNTTNTLNSDTTITTTSDSTTAPLTDTTTSDSGADSTTTATDTAAGSSTTDSTSETESEENETTQIASAEDDNKVTLKKTTKELPICR